MAKAMRLTFAGYPVEPPSGGRAAVCWARSSELRGLVGRFVESRQAVDALIASTRAEGRVEYELEAPKSIGFETPGGSWYETYPPGRYVVREMRDGFAVLWRLSEP